MSTKIEIITIGNELLEGSILNTNVGYVCKKLYMEGYLPISQCSVLDEKNALTSQIKKSLEKSDIVICSGGLGPTQDDITIGVAAKIFNSDFHIDEKLLKNLMKSYGKRLDAQSIEAFAKVPKKAELLMDRMGMAPGFLFKKGKKRLILLPGVPFEFEHLVEKELLPYLKKHFPPKIKEYKKIIHLCRVAESHITPFLNPFLKKYPGLKLGIYPHYGILSIHFKISTSNAKIADQTLNPCIRAVKKEFSNRWFDGKFDSIEAAIHDFFKNKKLSLSCAESCSGGALSAALTRLSGASEFFKGSVVSYCNDAKINTLGIKKETIEKHGAVSDECIREMALGANKLFKTDLAFATSGVAGPTGGTSKKPVGFIWIAIASRNKILVSQNLQLSGERATIIARTVNYLLAEFWINKDNV